MKIFNLAEELEKERKKNKELEERRKKDNYFICGLSRENKEQQDIIIKLVERIDKAIEYFNELEKENNKIIKFEVQHDEYQHIEAEAENTLIDNAKKILKGEKDD